MEWNWSVSSRNLCHIAYMRKKDEKNILYAVSFSPTIARGWRFKQSFASLIFPHYLHYRGFLF